MGRRDGGSGYHCLFPVFVTLGLNLVKFVSVAQNSGPFGGVVSGLRLSESGWAGGGWVLPSVLPGSQGCTLAVGFCVGVQRTEPSLPTMRQIAQGPGWDLNCGLGSGLHSAPRLLITSLRGLMTS